MGRQRLAFVVVLLAGLAAGRAARAEQLLNLKLSGGVGVSAYNVRTDSHLAPPFVQLQLSYLPLRTGPISMGPALGVPVGWFQREGQDAWDPQVAVRVGWEVWGRPNVDFAWSALAGADFVMTPPGQNAEEGDRTGFTWGLEIGGSASYFVTAGFAITAGASYNFFYGVDAVHVISFQLGVLISAEVVQ